MTSFGYLGAAVGGAALMYLLDPDGGRRRRALVRDQLVHAVHRTGDAVDVTSRDVKNRARGVVADLRERFSNERVPDSVLAERVRARIGEITGLGGGVEVSVDDGCVTLRGPVLVQEIDRLVRKVRGIRGVKDVDNRCSVHGEPGNIPSLQGRPRPPIGGEVFELLQTNWSPTARLLTGVGGFVMTATGVRRFDPLGAALAVLGLGLLARAVTNVPLSQGLQVARRVVASGTE